MEAIQEAPIDITHEVVPSTALTVSPIAEEKLALIDATDASLIQLLTKAQEIQKLGPITDREQAKTVHDFVQVAVKVRTRAAGLAKDEAAPFYEKGDDIVAYGKSIGERAKAAENLVRPLKDEWEEQEKREQNRLATEAANRLAARFDTLYGYGIRPVNGNYTLGDVTVEAVQIKALPDDKWSELIMQVDAAYQAQQDSKRAEEVKQQEEQQRLALVAQQQAEESKRLSDQKAAQDKLTNQLNKQRKDLISGRATRLVNAGFVESATNVFTYADHRLDEEAIIDIAEADLEQLLTTVRQLVADAKIAYDKQVEADAKAAQKKAADELKQKRKDDLERQKRLASDKKLMLALAKSVDTLAFPDLSNDESRLVQQEFSLQLFDAVERFRSQIEAL